MQEKQNANCTQVDPPSFQSERIREKGKYITQIVLRLILRLSKAKELGKRESTYLSSNKMFFAVKWSD